MKRLGIYLTISVLCIGLFGGITTSLTHAQTPTQQTAADYDYFYSKGTEVFSAGITALRDLKTTQSSKLADGPAKTLNLSQIDEKINLLEQTEQAYMISFANSRAKGTSPADAQIAAVTAGQSKYTDLYTSLSNATKQEPLSNAVIQVFVNQFNGNSGLLTEAKKIQNGTVQAGSVEAGTYGNAVAVSTAGKSVSDVAKNPNVCLSFTSFDLGACVDQFFSWIIRNTLLRIAQFLLWISATILNYSIKVGILDFKKWAPDTLYPIWIIVRQILSLLIVFSGLYLGFMYILGKSEVFEKYIAWLVVFALFVNFSYPITRALIDVSNIVSLKVYVAAVGEGALSPDPKASGTAGEKIMTALGVTPLLKQVQATKDGVEQPISQLNSTPSALLAVVMVLFAAFIFFNAAFIIIGRTAVLVFITIASPLLLIDSVFPRLDEAAEKLRALFVQQLIVAPVFMIMLALTLKFLDVFKGGGMLKSTAGDPITTFFNLTMMLVMLYIMNKVTKSISGAVGNFMTGAAGKVGGLGLGMATGGAAFLGRAGIGRMAAAARESKWVTNNQNSFLGRRAYDMSNSLAKSSYDLRNNSFVAGGMAKVGMGMGMGSKVGYDQMVDNRNKDVMERYNRIETRYTDDVYDSNGNILHRKGDINTEGVKAAARFRQSQTQGISSKIYGNKDKYNKDALWKELDKKNAEITQEDEKAMKAKEAEYKADYDKNPQTGRPTTALEKEQYLRDLREELEKTKKIDPELRGITGAALRSALAEIEENHKEELSKLRDEELKTLKEFTKTSKSDRVRKIDTTKGNPILQRKLKATDAYLEAEGDYSPEIQADEKNLGWKENMSPVEADAYKIRHDELEKKKSEYRKNRSYQTSLVNKKADELMKLGDAGAVKEIIKNDPFLELEEAHQKEIEKMTLELGTMNKEQRELQNVAIGTKKKAHIEMISNLKKEITTAYEQKSGVSLAFDQAPRVSTSSSPQPATTTSWPGQGDVNTPAYLRKEQSSGASPIQVEQPSARWAGKGNTTVPAVTRKAMDTATHPQAPSAPITTPPQQVNQEPEEVEIKPGFQKDAIDKIRERAERLKAEEKHTEYDGDIF